VVSFSLAEDDSVVATKDLVGELGCWKYFMSINTENKAFLKDWNSWLKTESYPAW